MTLLELQNIMGEHIKKIDCESMTQEERKEEKEKSETIARLAKQMINNADVVLRTDKLIAEDKLSSGSTISKIVGSEHGEQ